MPGVPTRIGSPNGQAPPPHRGVTEAAHLWRRLSRNISPFESMPISPVGFSMHFSANVRANTRLMSGTYAIDGDVPSCFAVGVLTFDSKLDIPVLETYHASSLALLGRSAYAIEVEGALNDGVHGFFRFEAGGDASVTLSYVHDRRGSSTMAP